MLRQIETVFIHSYQFILLREKLNNKVNKEAHEEGNEIISIDGIVVGPKNKLPQPPLAESSYPDDLVPQASIRRPATPPPTAPATKANVQIYSFKNDYGQREHVGVIFDGSSGGGPGPQVSNGLGLPNNKHHVLQHHQHQAQAASRHDRGHHYEPSSHGGAGAAAAGGAGGRHVDGGGQAQDGSGHHGQVPQNLANNFIPLEKKQPGSEVKSQEQAFPLGNPFLSPRLQARPEFFPPLHYPPLFKTKPQNLEGSFGPALPPKPEPDVIHFADEVLPGVVRETPKGQSSHQVQAQAPARHHRENQAYQYQRPPTTHHQGIVRNHPYITSTKELGGWGHKNANFSDVQYYLC